MTHKTKYFLYCLFMCICSSASANEYATIYYLPLNIETYSAVTPSYLPCYSGAPWRITNKQKINELLQLFKKDSQSNFSDQRTRAEIIFDSQQIWIDATGSAIKGSTKLRVDKSKFKEFMKSLPTNLRLKGSSITCH